MISPISSSASLIQSASTVQAKQELNEDQLNYVSSVLEDYDSSALSDADALEIVANFSQAGITPSRDLANAISDAGFSASQIGELAAITGTSASSSDTRGGNTPPPPPPPADTAEEEEELTQILLDLLDANEEETKEEEEPLSSSSSNTSFEDILDLSSKIVALNENSKDKVLELFEKYNTNENDLSKENVQKVVENSLNQILNDTNNYTPTSFYV